MSTAIPFFEWTGKREKMKWGHYIQSVITFELTERKVNEIQYHIQVFPVTDKKCVNNAWSDP
jgi:hypothetical protein